MDEPSPSGPENNKTHSVKADLTCDLCSKSYQRGKFPLAPKVRSAPSRATAISLRLRVLILTVLTDDLLRRHRRRCQVKRKRLNRRKACDECVKAKAKCSYTQPTCTRCTRRGTTCVYATAVEDSIQNGPGESVRESPPADAQHSPSARPESFEPSSQQFDIDMSGWDFNTTQYGLENFGMSLADLDPQLHAVAGFAPTQASHESLSFSPPSQAMSFSPATRSIPTDIVTPPSSIGGASSKTTLSSFSTSLKVVRVFSKYPSLLMKSSFTSPFLHRAMFALYSNVTPDMTFLPLTSMAVVCGGGVDIADNNRFFKRAMDAARERLIGSYVSAGGYSMLLT